MAEDVVVPSPLRTAYDRIISGMEAGRPQMVFDEFWREGELALMFGESGAGKSLLAMRLADTLASGGDIRWFRMECAAGKTLYVDMSMSDRQFASRNSYRGKSGKDRAFQVSKRLYCDRPPEDADLIEWLERRIVAEKLKYVVIDDLSSIMRTCDGTRDTVAAMRGLRRLRDRFGVSILVVMQSEAPNASTGVSEKDLGRQRVLCRLADSVFGIGHSRRSGYIYLAQTRSSSSKPKWTVHNPIRAKLAEYRGMPVLQFEMDISEEERKLIMAVLALRRKGVSFREIAVKLKVSKSRAHRLGRRWIDLYYTDLRAAREEAEDRWYEDPLENEDEVEDEGYLSEVGTVDREVQAPSLTVGLPTPDVPAGPMQGPEPCPFLYDKSDAAKRWRKFLFAKFPDKTDTEIVEGYVAGDEWCRPPGSRPPRDPADPFAGLEVDVDILGNIKYVEERFFDGKPSIYYAYRPDGKLYHFKWDRMALANANLFGKFADVGKNRIPREMPIRSG